MSVRDGDRVLAWDGPTRAFKWTLVALVFCGWLSNAYGGHVPAWHKWNGYAVLILVVFRLFWGIVGGSTARFRNFLKSPFAAFSYLRATLSGKQRLYLGHNPLGAYMIVALLALTAAQGLTGLYAADQDRLIIAGPLAATVSEAAVDFAAKWHHRLFTLIEIAVAAHVAANVIYQFVKGDRLISGMATGYKPQRAYVDEAAATPGSVAVALACLAAATAFVLGGIALAGGKVF